MPLSRQAATYALHLAVLFLPACGRPDPSPSVVPAAQRVEASSGPVRIVLELAQTSVRRTMVPDVGEAGKNTGYLDANIYYRAALENIGEKPIIAVGTIFFDPRTMRDDGVFLEVRDSKGGLVPPIPFFPPFHRMPPEHSRKLAPRESITSPEWARVNRPVLKGYTQAPYEFERAGRYRIRLVYDLTALRDLRKEHQLPSDPADIRLETKDLWIEISD